MTMEQLYQRFSAWVATQSSEDQAQLFAGSAKRFYRI